MKALIQKLRHGGPSVKPVQVGILGLLLIGALIFVTRHWDSRAEQSIHVALVGPMSGADAPTGIAMERGAQHFIENISAFDLPEESRIVLKVFDDRGDPKLAQAIAREIAATPEIAVVLGLQDRQSALEAGPIYRDAGIPVISGGSPVESVETDNPLIFNLLPADPTQGAQIAAFMIKVLAAPTVTIVYDRDAYGEGLFKGFEASAHRLGGEIQSFSFDSQSPDVDIALEQAAQEIRELKNPGPIFLATHAEEGVKLITSLYGHGFRFVGPDSFSDAFFIELLDRLPQERVKPGYFVGGAFSTIPLLLDTAEKQSKEFHNQYTKRYGEPPTWNAAAYHDAALLATMAIASALEGESNQPFRQRIAAYLASRNMPEKAVSGVTGSIRFDPQGAALNPLPVGIFNGHKLVAYREQLQPVRDTRRIDNALKDVLEGRLMLVNRQLVHRSHVVYSGMDINEISNVDPLTSTFTADFYIWFRSDIDIDVAQIEFLNSVKPVSLGTPIIDSTNDSALTTRAYRVRAEFRGDFNFYRYPFDSQELPIRLKHRTLTRDRILFVPDSLGMRERGKTERNLQAAFQSVSGWKVNETLFFQDEMRSDSSLGLEKFFEENLAMEYSRFSAVVRIERDARSFIIKNLFPMFFVLLISYVTFYITTFNARMGVTASALGTSAFLHLKFASAISVGYVVALEYFFFGVYILIALGLTATIFFHRMDERSKALGSGGAEFIKRSRKVDLVGRVVYPILVVVMSYTLVRIFTGD